MTFLVENISSKHYEVVEDHTDALKMADSGFYRLVSPLTRNPGYSTRYGVVYLDQWGGSWRQSTQLTNISDAMEKWG